MAAENTKNGWKLTSRVPESFTKRRHHTVPTRTESQNAPTAPLWRGSRPLSQNSISTKGYGWKSRIQSFTSKIAAQQPRLPPLRTNFGTAPNQTSRISELSVQQRMFTFQRKNTSNSTPTRTRES